MAAKLQEIEGAFVGERFRFGECLIGAIELADASLERAEAAGHSETVLTIKGDAEIDDLRFGQSYRFFGRFSTYHNRRTGRDEKQFHFASYVTARAHDRRGIVAYLAGIGEGCGMGAGTAAKLWERYGSNAVRQVRDDPRVIREVNKRVTDEQLEVIGRRLAEQAATEDAKIELTNLLSGRGFPKATINKAMKQWGNRAALQASRDPYSLMRFRGCGFKLCDALWLELGLPPDRLRRQALCAWYAVASNTDGHTWFHFKHVMRVMQTLLPNPDYKRAMALAVRLGKRSLDHYGALAACRTDGMKGPLIDSPGEIWIAEGRKAEAERSLARMVNEASDEVRPRRLTEYREVSAVTIEEAAAVIRCERCGRQLTAPEVHVLDGIPYGPTCIDYVSDGTGVEIVSLDQWIERQPPRVRSIIDQVPARTVDMPAFSLWPDPADIKVDAHQQAKLGDALVGRVAILGGSPGTGKTYATAQLIRSLRTKVGIDYIAVGAPTGKAAVRLTETMQAAGLPMQARTWHSLLGIGAKGEDGGEWGFKHSAANPWPYRVLIGDESSMLDTNLMRSIFAARPRGCHVLLVGDVNQLPPVGHGAPLRDLIAAGIPYGELREIKRNSGGIVEACAAIRDGKPWGAADNLKVTGSSGPERQIAEMMGAIRDAERDGLDPVWDCQVLVAVNARSPLSRKIVNSHLQDALNPSPRVEGTPFRRGDKIVCLKNGEYEVLEMDEDGEAVRREEGGKRYAYVANGELALVDDIEPGFLVAKLTSPHRVIRIPRGKATSGEGDGSEEKSSNGCSWDLGYALSVHKSQGSEWPVSIVLLDEYRGASMICSREWIYTAISRAKMRCVLVGKKHVADAMCRRVAIGDRKTFLRELIQLNRAEQLLETL